MIIYYTAAGEDIHAGELVSIDNNGKICRWRGERYYLIGTRLAAFAVATRDIRAGEMITFSEADDTDLRSRLTAEVLAG